MALVDTMCIACFDVAAAKYLEKDEWGMVRNKTKDPSTNIVYTKGTWESPFSKVLSCTNPLTWTSAAGCAEGKLHLGRAKVKLTCKDGTAPDMSPTREVRGVKLVSIEKVDVGVLSAEIVHDGGMVKISQLDHFDDYHNHTEWEDFYFNIRENVAQRVDAFLTN